VYILEERSGHTRVPGKHYEHGRDNKRERDLVLGDVGAELHGLEACLDDDGAGDRQGEVENVGDT
jgi:hypothetical protein